MFNKISFSENRRRYLNLKGIISGRYAYKGPDTVQIDLTDKCNSNCIVCWVHSPAVKKMSCFESLDFTKVKDFMHDISGLKVRDVIFSGGGEPFCYSEIWETLELTQTHGLNFHINTNFTLLKKEDIKRLCTFDKLSSLTISLWSGEADLYSKLHGRKKETFYELVENITFLNRIKPRKLYVKIVAIMNNANYRQLKGLTDLLNKIGCHNLEFGVCDAMPAATETFLLNSEQLILFKKNFNELQRYIKKKRYKIRIANREMFLKRILNPMACYGEYDTDAEKAPCYTGWVFLRLRSNGDFNSCLKSHRIPIGNIYNDNINVVWNNALQQQFREKTLSVPKDKEYFRLIGNDCNTVVGCKRVCDNMLLNKRVYDMVRFLSNFIYSRSSTKHLAQLEKQPF